jgi:membrane protein implicated in regulation of membrane protease activity
MSTALQGQPVLRFQDPGPPPYQRWCGRFQFALTVAQAKPHNGCRVPLAKTKTQKAPQITTSVPTTTVTIPAHTTTVSPTTTKPPTRTTTTQTTTTQPSDSGYPTQPDASPAVGQDGTVVKRVDAAGDGVIQVGGDYYKAMSADGSTIPVGTQVTVQDAQGDTAIVQGQQ